MRRITHPTLALLLAALLPLAAAADAGGGPPPAYFVDEAKLPFTALPGATAYWGVHTGAGYQAEVPDAWTVGGSLLILGGTLAAARRPAPPG